MLIEKREAEPRVKSEKAGQGKTSSPEGRGSINQKGARRNDARSQGKNEGAQKEEGPLFFFAQGTPGESEGTLSGGEKKGGE